MFKKWNRILAFLLSIALVTTTFGSDFASATAYAVGDEQELEERSGDELFEEASLDDLYENDEEEGEGSSGEYNEDEDESSNLGDDTDPETTPEENLVVDPENPENTEVVETTEDLEKELTEEETEEAEGNLVTVTYEATKGGKVSPKEETIDLDDEDAKFEGSTATAYTEYTFVNWTDENGEIVSTDETFVPSDIEEDATFTAHFEAAETVSEDYPEIVKPDVHAGGLIVSLKAEEGIFPKGTTVEIKGVSESLAMDTAKKELGDDVTAAVGVDITFYFEGKPIQPADDTYVHVNLELDEAIEGESFSVLHDHNGDVEQISADIETENTTNELGEETKLATAAEFDVDQFSVFIIASKDTDNTRKVEHYTFEVKDEDGKWVQFKDTQDIKVGDKLQYPGMPTLYEGQEFEGWYVWENNTYSSEPVVFGVEKTSGDIIADKEITIRAKYKVTYNVKFIGVGGIVAATKEVQEDEHGKAELKLDVNVTPEENQKFVGWINLVDKHFDDGATIDASDPNNSILTADIKDGFWVHFDENDGGDQGGASYTPPVFVVDGGYATRPANPTRNGYTFKGWYSNAACTGKEFDFDKTAIRGTTTVFAKWEKGNANFAVIVWTQNIDDDRNANDSQKTYDYYKTVVLEGKSTSKIDKNTIKSVADESITGFHYRTFKVVNKDTTVNADEISPKGTTVVNVYFDRNKITINFHYIKSNGHYNGGQIDTFIGLYGQNYSKYNYTFPSDEGFWAIEPYGSSGLVFGDAFTFKTSPIDFYQIPQGTSSWVKFYKQNDDLSWPSQYTSIVYGPSSNEIHLTTPRYSGFSASEYRYKYWNRWQRDYYWTDWKAVENKHIEYGNGVEIRFKRDSFNLEVQSTFDPSETPVPPAGYQNNKVEETYTLPYESVMSGQDNSVKNDALGLAGTKTPPTGYIAKTNSKGEVVLWADEAGTQEFDWSKRMPASNDTRAYIVWVKAKFEVNLDLNVDNDQNPETKTGYDAVQKAQGASTNFHVVYNGTVDKDSITTKFVYPGYELVGWYDKDTNQPYSYGKVTGHVNLYAKWRRQGAVKIYYNEKSAVVVDGVEKQVEGTITSNWDSNTYAADSKVVVKEAPTNVTQGFAFVGWNLLGKDGSVKGLYLPNGHFVIDDTLIVSETINGVTTNVVTLQAVYEKSNAGVPQYTFIKYHPNLVDDKGTGTVQTVTEVSDGTETHKIRVNEAVKVWGLTEANAAGFLQPGYELIGWNTDQNAAKNGITAVDFTEQFCAVADNENLQKNPNANTLYAVWKQLKGTYKVEYYVGDDKKGESKVYEVAAGTEITLTNTATDNQPSINAYKQYGYKDGVQKNGSYTVVADKYATTKPQIIRVDYDPISVVVTIKANSNKNLTYNGKSQTVSGIKEFSIKDSDGNDVTGLSRNDIVLTNGDVIDSVSIEKTEVGQYNMGLAGNTEADKAAGKTCSFKIAGDKAATFTDVTFVVSGGEMEIKKATVTVKIVGNYSKVDYNGEKHEVEGYTYSSSKTFYTDKDFEFTGTSKKISESDVKRKADGTADKYMMGLTANMFKNNNNNCDVTFVLKDDQGNSTDGWLQIDPVDVTVSIKGNQKPNQVYTGKEQTVEGFESINISRPTLYTKNDFALADGVEASAALTNVGTEYMGLAGNTQADKDARKTCSFVNNNDNFNVTFEVVDGFIEIVAYTEKITVTITGNHAEKDYDSDEATVSGYTVSISNAELYKESYFALKDGINTTLKSTNICDLTMGLKGSNAGDECSFVNNNTNFTNVEFVVTDGYLKINPLAVTVTITADTAAEEVVYDGTDHTIKGFKAATSNDLYNVTERTAYFDFDYNEDGTADAWDTPTATQKEVGIASIVLQQKMFENKNTNFAVTFVLNNGSVTVVKRAVTVTVTGHNDTATYNKEYHEVKGYDISTQDNVYSLDLVKGPNKDTEPRIREKEAKATPYYMGLAGNTEADVTAGKTCSFTNTDTANFDVTFVVTDGWLKINATTESVTVTITGNNNGEGDAYTGSEQSVSGYTVKIEGSNLYSEGDITFTAPEGMDLTEDKKPVVKATNASTENYPMGLAKSQFKNNNANFTDVTINVVDGWLKINPAAATVRITGNTLTETYDGTAKTVSGYTKSVVTDPTGKYNDAKVVYNGTSDSITETNVKRSGNSVGKYTMGLVAGDFTNVDTNYTVTFVLTDDQGNSTDGWLQINPLAATINIKGTQKTFVYDDKEHTAEGWAVVENDVYNELVANKKFDTASVEAKNPTAEKFFLKRTVVGKDNMKLAPSDFTCTDGNFNVTFVIAEGDDGYLDITPVEHVVVKIKGKTDTKTYNKDFQTVSGYTIQITDASGLYKEEYVTFTPTDKVVCIEENGKKVPVAKGKAASETPYKMGLTADMFTNNNDNFKNVDIQLDNDGWLVIEPLAMDINIAGNIAEYSFDGNKHSVKGFVASSTNKFFDADEVTYSEDKNLTITQTDVKVDEDGNVKAYTMGLEKNKFGYSDSSIVPTYTVTRDGSLTINPLDITIDVYGNHTTEEKPVLFNGRLQFVKGYELKFENGTTASAKVGDEEETSTAISADGVKKLYDTDDISFNGEARAEGILADHYPMNLDAEQFTNNNSNFVVTFNIHDGYLDISNRGAQRYNIVMKSPSVESVYNGYEQSYTILASVEDITSTNPVVETLEKLAELVKNFFVVTSDAEDGDITFTAEGVEYTMHNVKVTAKGTNAGDKKQFTLDETPYITLNIDGEECDVTPEFNTPDTTGLGYLTITKAPIKVTVDNKTKVAGTADPTLTGTVDGVQGRDVVNVTYTRAPGETVGTPYAITTTLSAEALEELYPNYTFTVVPGTFTITAAPSDDDDDDDDDTTTIPDAPIALAPAPTGAVLGAQRETGDGPAVLGARRAGTDDETNRMARVFAMVAAAAIAVTMMITGKKKDEEEEG